MARKPTLSPSKLTTYLACPVRYRWTYVDDRGKWLLRAKSYYSFGTSLHRVLERLHGEGGSGVDIAEQLGAVYEESWIDAGFSSAEEMAEAYHDGKEMISLHVAQTRARKSAARVLHVEKNLKLDLGSFDLVGRADRIDEHPDGTLEIVDYKTARSEVTESDVANDIALSCYALMLARENPDRRIVATIEALRTGRSASAEMAPEPLAAFERDVLRLGEEILSAMESHYELVPRRKPLCLNCDFVSLCRRQEDYALELEAELESATGSNNPHSGL